MYDLVIFIAGPEMHHCYNEDLAFLNYFSRKVVCIGDGKQNLLNQKSNILKEEFYKLSNITLPEKILTYVSAHGSAFNSEHFILTDINQFGREATEDSVLFYTKDLFDLFASVIKKKFDVIFFPCASRFAVKNVSSLPRGSNVVIIEGYSAPHAARDAIIKMNIKPEYFNINFYYDNLLANLGYYIDPILVESGGVIIDPVASASDYLGKSISAEEKSYIYKNFSMNVCNENKLCFDRLDKILTKISTAKSLTEFMEHNSGLINDFLFVSIWIELHCPYVINKDEIQEQILKFKYELDEYLVNLNLPFELDLNSDFWPV